jgi:cyclophilin family peptidyl-prolyl cis-trans isomerase
MKLTAKNLILILLFSVLSSVASAQIIRMETVFGNIDIEMHPDAAPNTVANFLNYMNRGDYNNSFIHRNGRSEGVVFVIQGGGFKFIAGQPFVIEKDPPVDNEFLLSNVRGTIAMAKFQDQPNSATSEWFFNTADNSALLDDGAGGANANSGGFTVFGTVIAGMEVVDTIAAIETFEAAFNFANTVFSFGEIPLLNGIPNILTENDVALITNVLEIGGPLKINSGLNGAWFNPATSGQGILLEALPTSNSMFMAWFTYDTQAPDDGVVANVGDAGHRWLTGLGSIDQENNSITFDLVLSTGGLFDNKQAVQNSAPNSYGTLTITFTDCSNATVTYNLIAQGLTGTFPLTRIAGDNIALCQRLSSEAN